MTIGLPAGIGHPGGAPVRMAMQSAGVRFLLRARFDGPDAAAPLGGSLGPPYVEIGALTLVDTGNKLSISGNKMQIAGATGVNNPLIRGGAQMRRAGLAAVFEYTPNGASPTGSHDLVQVGNLGGAFGADEGIAALNVTSFNQSLGPELLSNGNMESGDPPTGWSSLNNAVLDGVADERTGGAGAQSLDVARAGLADASASQNFTATVGAWYMLDGWGKRIEAGNGMALVLADTGYLWTPQYLSSASWSRYRRFERAKGTGMSCRCVLFATADGTHARADDVSVRRITLNTQQVMPADAILDLAFALPESPFSTQTIALYYRIAGTLESDDDWWVAYIRRNLNNTAWDLVLQSVSNGVATTRITISNVGTPDMLRVSCDGAKHNVWTRQGGIWTKRGSEVNVSHNNTQTGVNVIYDPGITPLSLRAYARRSALYNALDA